MASRGSPALAYPQIFRLLATNVKIYETHPNWMILESFLSSNFAPLSKYVYCTDNVLASEWPTHLVVLHNGYNCWFGHPLFSNRSTVHSQFFFIHSIASFERQAKRKIYTLTVAVHMLSIWGCLVRCSLNCRIETYSWLCGVHPVDCEIPSNLIRNVFL